MNASSFCPATSPLLDVRNVTVEELAHWFLRQLRAREEFERLPIQAITLRASSGPGQWASAEMELS